MNQQYCPSRKQMKLNFDNKIYYSGQLNIKKVIYCVIMVWRFKVFFNLFRTLESLLFLQEQFVYLWRRGFGALDMPYPNKRRKCLLALHALSIRRDGDRATGNHSPAIHHFYKRRFYFTVIYIFVLNFVDGFISVRQYLLIFCLICNW